MENNSRNLKQSIFSARALMIPGLLLLSVFTTNAQQRAVTLPELIQMAEEHYPLLKSKRLDVQAAQKGVDAGKSTFIPTLDASYQLGYATYNNITGMSYPGQLLPISGPPSADNRYSGVFGSAAGLLLNWQPVTFGQRQSQVNFARAGVQYADADAANEIFRHKIKVAGAYLELLTLNELTSVYENNLERLVSNLTNVQSLIVSGIRPGVDSPLLKAEISRAKVELIGHRNKQAQARIVLSELVMSDTLRPFSDTLFFNQLPQMASRPDSAEHPLIALYNAGNEINLARKDMIAKTARPTLGVWGTTYARGSGISHDGVVKPADGLGLQRFNYGVGLQLTVPLLQLARIRPQLSQQDLLISSGQQKLDAATLQLRTQKELADTTLAAAFAAAQESPLYLQSAQFSYRAVESRYASGLATLPDLFQAQYALVKAEADYKLAYMAAWRALLYKAAVEGDLNIFINQAK